MVFLSFLACVSAKAATDCLADSTSYQDCDIDNSSIIFCQLDYAEPPLGCSHTPATKGYCYKDSTTKKIYRLMGASATSGKLCEIVYITPGIDFCQITINDCPFMKAPGPRDSTAGFSVPYYEGVSTYSPGRLQSYKVFSMNNLPGVQIPNNPGATEGTIEYWGASPFHLDTVVEMVAKPIPAAVPPLDLNPYGRNNTDGTLAPPLNTTDSWKLFKDIFTRSCSDPSMNADMSTHLYCDKRYMLDQYFTPIGPVAGALNSSAPYALSSESNSDTVLTSLRNGKQTVIFDNACSSDANYPTLAAKTKCCTETRVKFWFDFCTLNKRIIRKFDKAPALPNAAPTAYSPIPNADSTGVEFVFSHYANKKLPQRIRNVDPVRGWWIGHGLD